MNSSLKVLLLAAYVGAISSVAIAAEEQKSTEAAKENTSATEMQAGKAEAKAETKDYVVIKYSGGTINKSEVDKELKAAMPGAAEADFTSFPPQLQENIVRNIVAQRIIFEEAKKNGMENNEEIEKRLQQIRKQLVMDSYIKKKAKDLVKEEDLKKSYDERIKQQQGKEEVKASHILVSTEKEANEVLASLKKGGDFAAIAKEKSKDPGSAQNGGDLGFFSEEQMVKPFSDAAFKLKNGELSKPVKSDFGWHVIKAAERRKATPPSFDEMKPQLTAEAEGKAVSNYLNGVFDRANVEIMDADGKSRKVASAPAEENKTSKQ